VGDFYSLSALGRGDACPGSGLLPQVRSQADAASMGSAQHGHLHMRAVIGVDEALRRLPEVAARWGLSEEDASILAWRCRQFEWSPPTGAIAEVALALFEDGSVARVKGARGEYEAPPGTVTAGTIDVLWAEPDPIVIGSDGAPMCPPTSTLWVADYKCGDPANVAPVLTNMQLQGAAVLAARWLKARRVVPAIIFPNEGPQGEWDVPEAPWTLDNLAIFERRIVDVQRRRLAIVNGTAKLEVNEGSWCTFCQASLACPAKIATFKAIAGDPLPMDPRVFDEKQVRWLAAHLKEIERFAARAREVLVEHCQENGPIDLGNGLAWGAVVEKRTSLRPKVALPILATILANGNRDEAEAAIWSTVTMSKDAVETKIRDVLRARGIKRQGAATVRRFFADLKDADGLEERTTTKYTTFRTDAADPSKQPLLLALPPDAEIDE